MHRPKKRIVDQPRRKVKDTAVKVLAVVEALRLARTVLNHPLLAEIIKEIKKKHDSRRERIEH